mgnify:CR=1 FL=1
MSLQVEKLEHNMAKLTIEVSAEEVEKALQAAYLKERSKISLPGFRKGKVPRQMIEKMYGPEVFYDEAANRMISEAYAKAYDESELEIASQPTIDIVQLEKGKPFIFTAEVAVKPEVKLGEYKGLKVDKYSTRVTQKEVDEEIEKVREQHARIVEVTDRAVADKDDVTLDFEGFVDGVAFEGGKAENHELEIGSNTFIPGFEDQIIGMKIDEEKDINVKFPEEYFSKELAGKDAVFKVKLHEIKRKELPTIDDEFAKDVSEFDTLKELKASIKEKLEEENKNRAKYETEEEAIKTVCDQVEIEIPSGMIETEVDNMVKDVEVRLSYQGLKLDQYLKMMNKSEEEFRKEFEEQAKKSVKSRLILEAIGKDAKIEVSEEEIANKVKEMATNYGRKEEELLGNEELKQYLENSMKTEKAVQYIVDNAKIK